MGLHGSCTTPILCRKLKVPADNVSARSGKAQGCAQTPELRGLSRRMCSGGCARRLASGEVRKTAKKFGIRSPTSGNQYSSRYGAHLCLESLMYRTAGMIDATVGKRPRASAIAAALEELAVEASIGR